MKKIKDLFYRNRAARISEAALKELDEYIKRRKAEAAAEAAEKTSAVNAYEAEYLYKIEAAKLCGSAPASAPEHAPLPASGQHHFKPQLHQSFHKIVSKPMAAQENEIETDAMPFFDADYAKIPAPSHAQFPEELEEALRRKRSSFQKELFRLIDRSGLTDPQVYKRAHISRKLFSKIRCDENYIPSKNTIIALAAALELSLDETQDLLNVAGYSLSPSSDFDIIIEHCIKNQIHDVMTINDYLYVKGQPILSA